MAHLHRQFPDNVKVVLADDGTIGDIPENHLDYLKSKNNPHGIPAWKVSSTLLAGAHAVLPFLILP